METFLEGNSAAHFKHVKNVHIFSARNVTCRNWLDVHKISVQGGSLCFYSLLGRYGSNWRVQEDKSNCATYTQLLNLAVQQTSWYIKITHLIRSKRWRAKKIFSQSHCVTRRPGERTQRIPPFYEVLTCWVLRVKRCKLGDSKKIF